MPEGVWVNMGKVMTVCKFLQPVIDRVRIHSVAVIPSEEESVILIISLFVYLFLVLCILPPPEQGHGLFWQRNVPDGSFRFGCLFIYSTLDRIEDFVMDVDSATLKIYGIPFQSQNLTPACAADE